jgi:hypothetical protein
MVFKNTAISNNTDAIGTEATTRADAITAEALARNDCNFSRTSARTTADYQNTAISNNGCYNSRSYNQSRDAIKAENAKEQQQMVFKTQLFLIIRMQ